MPNNQDRKKFVRRYADENSISYTAASRQIDSDARFWLRVNDEWAADRELIAHGPAAVCLHGVASATGVTPHRYAGDCRLTVTHGPILDHIRVWDVRPAGARRRAAVVSLGPYIADTSESRDDVAELAGLYDLAWRFGEERDRSYGFGTVPVVLWNPRVINLN